MRAMQTPSALSKNTIHSSPDGTFNAPDCLNAVVENHVPSEGVETCSVVEVCVRRVHISDTTFGIGLSQPYEGGT